MKLVISGLLIIALVIAGVYSMFYGTPWGKYVMKKQSINYVEEKYNKEITIKEVKYSLKSSTFFSNSYYSIAYLNEQPEVVFTIDKFRDKTTGKYKIIDNLPRSLWRYEVSSELSPYVKNIFSGEVLASLIIPINAFQEEDVNSKEVQSYHEIREKFKKNIEIRIYIERDFDINNPNEEYLKIYEVLQFIEENKYKPDKVAVCFCKILGSSADWKTYKRDRIDFEITYEELQNIKTYEEIKHYKK
jgi:hypothetical protein